MEYYSKFISSLEKCYYDDAYDSKKQIVTLSCLKNEKLGLQVAYIVYDNEIRDKVPCHIIIKSKLRKFIKVYKIECVPSRFPVFVNREAKDYDRTKPDFFPDLMMPYEKDGEVYFVPDLLQAIFIEVDLSKNNDLSGMYEIEVIFKNRDNLTLSSSCVSLEIINAKMKEQELTFSQWFHCDCLSSYYSVKPLSDKHFKIIDSFIKTAVEYGINTILTPVLTPPLDTKVGGERPTVQLVRIKYNGIKYSYSYELLDKWIAMCIRNGIKHFEISHLFTQWGVKSAPKVVAYVNGKLKRIFGWETDASSIEYIIFLRDFLINLIDHLKKLGCDKMCIFHISDEPNEQYMENYKRAKESIMDILKGYLVVDALSNYEFYSKGIVEHPIPATNHIDEFIKNSVPDLWAYYCCGQYDEVSNRFLSMPSYRNRIIGTQLYKYDIKGFLHWGYNFYYNQYSRKLINPFIITDGDFFAPSGDAYSVYPGHDRKPLLSLRLVIFNEALQDIRVMKTLESMTDKQTVMNIIEDGLTEEITFKKYPKGNEYLISMREKLNKKIKSLI
jgi:hypothetical protein